jgi:hypothetical protein
MGSKPLRGCVRGQKLVCSAQKGALDGLDSGGFLQLSRHWHRDS